MAKRETLKELIARQAAETEARRVYREDLAQRVEAAQQAYLDYAKIGKSRTKAAREAEKIRDELEEELIQLDTLMHMNGQTPVEKLPIYTRLERSEREWKRALSTAAKAGSAGGVARALRELEAIWKAKDERKGL